MVNPSNRLFSSPRGAMVSETRAKYRTAQNGYLPLCMLVFAMIDHIDIDENNDYRNE